MEEVSRMYNYDIILSSSYGNPNREIELLKLLKGKQVEGIVFISENFDENVLATIEEINIPFIYLNKYYESHSLPSVAIDNFQAAYKMTEYLQELGHKKILYISDNNNQENSIGKLKTGGYRKALEEKGLKNYILAVNGIKVEDGYNIGNPVMELIKEKVLQQYFVIKMKLP